MQRHDKTIFVNILLTLGLISVLFIMLWQLDAFSKAKIEAKFNAEITEQEWELIDNPNELGKDIIRGFGKETYVRMVLMGCRFDGESLSPAEANEIFDKINDGYGVVGDGVE